MRAARRLPCSGTPAQVYPGHRGTRPPAQPLQFGVAPYITLCCSLCQEPGGQPRGESFSLPLQRKEQPCATHVFSIVGSGISAEIAHLSISGDAWWPPLRVAVPTMAGCTQHWALACHCWGLTSTGCFLPGCSCHPCSQQLPRLAQSVWKCPGQGSHRAATSPGVRKHIRAAHHCVTLCGCHCPGTSLGWHIPI